MKELTDRQREILDFICRYRDQSGFPPSVRDIGGKFGLSPATVHDHIKALERKGSLARHPHRSRSLAPVREMDPAEKHVASRDPFRRAGTPLVGRVAAGSPILADENLEDVIQLPEEWASSGTFLLRVVGESMRDAHILDGDLVLVRPQRSASNGEIVVALIEDEATVKRFHKTPTGVELVAENPAFAPIVVPAADEGQFQILGKVVGVFRPEPRGQRKRRGRPPEVQGSNLRESR